MIRIFTDTSANLPPALARQYHITVIPFRYTVGSEEFFAPEDGSFDGEAFYAAMENGAEVKTSMINSFAFCEAFEKAALDGDDVLYIGMSSGISGTYGESVAAAREMKERYPERKFVTIDTLGASLGEGMQVLYAAKLAEQGLSLEEITQKTESILDYVCQYFTVGDLEYLRRGGRLSRISAVMGTILNIKPLLMGNEEGKIVLFHKARGRKRSLDALAEKYAELADDLSASVGIAHCACEDDAAYLEQKLRAKGCEGEVISVWYEPVTGSHVGPGTVALFFYGIHR